MINCIRFVAQQESGDTPQDSLILQDEWRKRRLRSMVDQRKRGAWPAYLYHSIKTDANRNINGKFWFPRIVKICCGASETLGADTREPQRSKIERCAKDRRGTRETRESCRNSSLFGGESSSEEVDSRRRSRSKPAAIVSRLLGSLS